MTGGLGEVQSARLVHLGLHDAGDDLLDGSSTVMVPAAQLGQVRRQA